MPRVKVGCVRSFRRIKLILLECKIDFAGVQNLFCFFWSAKLILLECKIHFASFGMHVILLLFSFQIHFASFGVQNSFCEGQ